MRIVAASKQKKHKPVVAEIAAVKFEKEIVRSWAFGHFSIHYMPDKFCPLNYGLCADSWLHTHEYCESHSLTTTTTSLSDMIRIIMV